MKKMTLKEVKNMVNLGLAKDVTNSKNVPKCDEKVGYCVGVYGISGGLYFDTDNNLCAIKCRNSNLFRIF